MTSTRAFLLTVLAYAAVIGMFSSLPWSDLPNHLTRITIVSSLLFAPTAFVTQHYAFHWMFTPYLLWDVLAAITGVFLPVVANGILWSIVTFAIVVAGGFYLALRRLRERNHVLVLALLSITIGADWFFCMGFFAYQISFGISLLAVGLGHKFRERPGGGTYLLYLVTVSACYLTHLAGFLGLCLAAGAAGLAMFLKSPRNWLREGALLFPPVLIACYHVLHAPPVIPEGDPYVWGSVTGTLLALAAPWLRFGGWDAPLLLGLSVMFLFLLRRARLPGRRDLPWALLTDDLFLAALFTGVADLLLPNGGEVWYVGIRMLPYSVYFAVSWLVSLPPKKECGHAAASVPGAVRSMTATCWIGLIILVIQLWPSLRTVAAYRQLLSHIPEHRTVLPVFTVPNIGRVPTMIHQGCLYAAFKEGVVPSVFDDRVTLPFFHIRERPEIPSIFWYVRHEHPDWSRVGMGIDYLVITKPFDRARLPKPAAPILFENNVGAVLDMRS